MAAKRKTTRSAGLAKNQAGALAYVLGPVTGIIFLILEDDPFVKFHAMQSIIVLGGLLVIQWVMGVTIILLPLVPLIGLVGFALWLLLIFKAWQGEKWEVPFLGKFVRDFLKKV